MSDKEIKLKVNRRALKCVAIIFFLLWNLVFIGGDGGDDKTFLMWYYIIVNSLALITFVLSCIFPRSYYVIDERGISYRNGKGKQKREILWKDITFFGYLYFTIIPVDVEIKYCSDCKEEKAILEISHKQYLRIIEEFNLKTQYNIRFS